MANVDSSELAKFASRAAEWWDPHGAFRTLHDINALRLDYIAARVALAARACSTSAAAAASWPRAWPRAARASSRSTWRRRTSTPRDNTPRPAACTIDYRCVAVEQLAADAAGAVRCRHLPRDARARAGAGIDRGGVRHRAAARRNGVLLDDQPQLEELRARDRRRRVRARLAAARHARIREADSARPSSRPGAARRAST